MKLNIKCCLPVVPQPSCASSALLFVRLVAGVAFVLHGWGKIQNPMGWMGPESPVPGFFQLLAAVSEFGGGIAWIIGFLTPFASFGIACTMAVAVFMHMVVMKDPFVNMTGGSSFEPALGYLATAILILVIGPGKFSIDAKVFGDRK